MLKRVILAVILLVYTLNITAQDKKILPLQDFIKLTTANNPEFREILIDELYLKYTEDLKLSPQSLIMDVETAYQLNLESSEENDYSSGISLSKLFPQTGTTGAINYQDNSGIKFTLNQDISGNIFGKKHKLEKDNITRENEISRYQITETYEDYLGSLITIYFQWYQYYENLSMANTAYNDARTLLNQVIEKRKLNIADNSDVNKAKLQLISKEENLLELESSYNQYLLLIETAISENINYEMIPDRNGLSFNFEKSFNSLFEDFENNSRTYKMLDKLTQYGITESEIKKRNLFPDISLFIDFTTDPLDSSSAITTQDSVNFGINFTHSFGNGTEEAQYETSLIDHEKTLLQNKNTKITKRTQLENLYNQIVKTQNIMKLYDTKIVIAEELVKDERYKYSIGKSDLNTLLTEVNSLDAYKSKRESTRASLNTLVVDWLRITDKLVEKL